MPHDIEKGLEAGFFRYLTKPILVREFMSVLTEALEFAAERLRHTQEKKEAGQSSRGDAPPTPNLNPNPNQ